MNLEHHQQNGVVVGVIHYNVAVIMVQHTGVVVQYNVVAVLDLGQYTVVVVFEVVQYNVAVVLDLVQQLCACANQQLDVAQGQSQLAVGGVGWLC